MDDAPRAGRCTYLRFTLPHDEVEPFVVAVLGEKTYAEYSEEYYELKPAASFPTGQGGRPSWFNTAEVRNGRYYNANSVCLAVDDDTGTIYIIEGE